MGEFSPPDMSLEQVGYDKNAAGPTMGHFASVDQTNMQVLHSMVKEKRPI